ncbi:MAG: hypothetical protein AAF664_13670 [Planctomycetota bacterium]
MQSIESQYDQVTRPFRDLSEPIVLQPTSIQPLWDAWDRSRLPTIIHDGQTLPNANLLTRLASLAKAQSGHPLRIHWLQPKGLRQALVRLTVERILSQFERERDASDPPIDFVPWFGPHSFLRVNVRDSSWRPHLVIQSRRELLHPWMLAIGLSLKDAA